MKKKYSIKQKLIAAFCNSNVEWHYATEVERLVMRFESLSDINKTIFLNKIKNGKK